MTVTAGSVVTWNNTGAKAHTVTADDGSFDSGNLDPGQAFGNLFDTAGTFAYHDARRPNAQGLRHRDRRGTDRERGRHARTDSPARDSSAWLRVAERRDRDGRAEPIGLGRQRHAQLHDVDPVLHRRCRGDRTRHLLRATPAATGRLNRTGTRYERTAPAEARAVRLCPG